jgi:hypothetical protein
VSRSRRAGIPRDEVRLRPLYARLLGLQYLRPSGFLCFVFLEGAVALGILLALAELVSWWGVLVLPVSVAAMVKVNDVVAGALTRPPRHGGTRVVRPAAAPVRRLAGTPGAGAVYGPAPAGRSTSAGPGAAPGGNAVDPAAALHLQSPVGPGARDAQAGTPQQRIRHSASRRYEQG